MLQYVLERFLRHAIEAGGHLDGDRFRHVSRDIPNGKRRALCELVGMILNGCFEAQMFQAGGVEPVGEVVDVIRKLFGCFSKTPTVRQQVRRRLTQSFERACIDRQTRKTLRDIVMQIARNALSFEFLRREQFRGQLLQFRLMPAQFLLGSLAPADVDLETDEFNRCAGLIVKDAHLIVQPAIPPVPMAESVFIDMPLLFKNG